MKKLIPALLMTLTASASVFAQSDFEATSEKIKAAMASDVRTEAETDRDRNRRPLQTLEFFGLRDDMRVVELIPGGGWYTKILAPVVREKGEYYAGIGAGRLRTILEGKAGFDKVNIIAEDAEFERGEEQGVPLTSMKIDSLGVKDVDIVFTFRNYHNFTEEGRKAMNKVAFDALKPGGIYAVVDHTKRHMEPLTRDNRRRVDPVLAIKEILDAGFEFVDYTNLHRRQDDELRYEVGVKTVTGNTDRWTFKFRKPE